MDSKLNEATQKKWSLIVDKAFKDEKFRKRLLSNPSKVLKEEGLNLPEGIDISVLEDTKNKKYLILPEKPQSHLTDEQLRKIAAGATREYKEGLGM